MKEKLLLIGHLNQKLRLGFEKQLEKRGEREEFERLVEEKERENKILWNFEVIESLKKEIKN